VPIGTSVGRQFPAEILSRQLRRTGQQPYGPRGLTAHPVDALPTASARPKFDSAVRLPWVLPDAGNRHRSSDRCRPAGSVTNMVGTNVSLSAEPPRA
jgi:hypothetical protein